MREDYHLPDAPIIAMDDYWKQKNDTVLIDVRAPSEYEGGAISKAINIPLFSNIERSEIGTIYKYFGKPKALDKGYDLLKESFPHLEKAFIQYKSSKMVVYCARGGLRSKISVNILRSLGYDATQMIGGYKSYRNWGIDKLKELSDFKLVMLHGLAGTGKTFILDNMENSLNLEKLAGHSGSSFGAIGEKPETQKQFEANLIERLDELNKTKSIFVEAESRKIGKLEIPEHLFVKMRQAIPVLIEAPVQIRVERMKDRYIFQTPENQKELKEAIQKIKSYLSKKDYAQLEEWIDQEKYDDFWEFLLINHYDPKYKSSMKKYTFEHIFDGTNPPETATQLESIFEI